MQIANRSLLRPDGMTQNGRIGMGETLPDGTKILILMVGDTGFEPVTPAV
jgi:hypothetical protein